MAENLWGMILLLALNIWVAWRYAWQPIGPDEGMWLLWGFTGAKPYKDFIDCKPPGIHLWMWFLARLTGRRLMLVKFLHHLAMGSIAIAAYFYTDSLGTGLLATWWLQSAWLLAYQSWMDAVSAGFLLLAAVAPPVSAVVFVGLATLFNVKAVLPGAVLLVGYGYWLPTGMAGALGAALLGLWYVVNPASLRAVWYGSVTVPRRMKTWRAETAKPDWEVWHSMFSTHLLLIVVAVGLCLVTSPDPVLWVAAGVYIGFNAWGGVWRANHSIPLAMVAAAGPDPTFAALILAADWIAARGYLGNIWQTTYPAIAPLLAQAAMTGTRLRQEAGSLWVNSWNTQIYVYAQKAPQWDVPQLEIWDVVPERQMAREEQLRAQPPDWIVIGPGFAPGEPRGFRQKAEYGAFAVLG